MRLNNDSYNYRFPKYSNISTAEGLHLTTVDALSERKIIMVTL